MVSDVTIPADVVREELAAIYCGIFGHSHSGRPECAGTEAADRAIARMYRPRPKSLRDEAVRMVRTCMSLTDAEIADAVLAVVKAHIEALPWNAYGETADLRADVLALFGEGP